MEDIADRCFQPANARRGSATFQHPYVGASTSIEGKGKTKLGNAIQVACQREQRENHIVTSNHEIVNHRRVGGFENIRPEHPTVSIDDVVGHGVTAKMIGHVTETVKLARLRINFRVRCHGAFDAIGVMTVAF